MGKSVLLCKKLFNVKTQTVDTDMAVFVDGEKIEKVCKQSSPADYVGYEIIDRAISLLCPVLSTAISIFRRTAPLTLLQLSPT